MSKQGFSHIGNNRRSDLLLGCLHWMKAHNPEAAEHLEALELSAPPENMDGFSTVDILGITDFQTWELDKMSSDQVDALQQEFMKSGMVGYLEDGIITPEEWVMHTSAIGAASHQNDPASFMFGDAEIEAARLVLEKNGVDDPDGSIAEGMAAYAERLATRVNSGLGISAPDLGEQLATVPTQSASVFSSPVFAMS